jgi:hypothetical protein
LLVSGSQAGQRVRQHGNAINAAKAAGMRFIAYTSGVRANTSTLLAMKDHQATEQLLAEAGIPHALLRNSWYLENYTGQLPVYLERGIVGAAGTGKVSAAMRADYAEAAAAVLAGEGHAGAVYELGGEPFTMAELAEVISVATGRTVTYTDLPVEQYQAVLVGAGLPEAMGWPPWWPTVIVGSRPASCWSRVTTSSGFWAGRRRRWLTPSPPRSRSCAADRPRQHRRRRRRWLEVVGLASGRPSPPPGWGRSPAGCWPTTSISSVS